MAWTAPRTWVTGEQVTAAIMNSAVRDNFLETSAATVTTAGDLAYADAANSMGSRVGIGTVNSLLVSTGSAPAWRTPGVDGDTNTNTYNSSNGTVYVPLIDANWGFASDIAVTVTTGTKALVMWRCRLSNSTAGALTYLSYSVSSATTVAAADTHSLNYESGAANDSSESSQFDYRTLLTAGSNVFTLEGRVPSGVGSITRPELLVVGF